MVVTEVAIHGAIKDTINMDTYIDEKPTSSSIKASTS